MNAVDLQRDIQGAGFANSKMASFITTMLVSPFSPDISLSSCSGCLYPNTNGSISHLNYFSSNKLCDGEEVVRKADKNLGLTYHITRNARTRGQFKPKHASKGTSSYQLRQFAEATLGSGSLRKAVRLPEGEDLSEWLAVNSNENTVSA